MDEHETDEQEDHAPIIRAKWMIDGAETLSEAAAKLRSFADDLGPLYESQRNVARSFGRKVEALARLRVPLVVLWEEDLARDLDRAVAALAGHGGGR